MQTYIDTENEWRPDAISTALPQETGKFTRRRTHEGEYSVEIQIIFLRLDIPQLVPRY